MRAPALLVLEDGSAFRGTAFGAAGETVGEAVFNTAMSGYQEVLTDPSYAGQIVVMTAPQQGNYGTNGDDPESGRVHVAGFAVREASRRASGWRAERTLADELANAGVVGIEGIDTRRLTLRLREHGAMRCGLSTEDLDPGSLLERVRSSPPMEGADLARTVTTPEPYDAASVVGPASSDHGRIYRVAAYDFGIKTNILRLLAAAGCETTVFPAEAPPADILAGGFDGVFLSNGPGDPAATTYGIEVARAFLGTLPVFGICLGHQLLALALGGRTYKLPFGHRGTNQPVKDLRTGTIEISSHNHGFAVDPSAWEGGAPPSAPGTPPPLARGSFDVAPGASDGARGRSGQGPAVPPVATTGSGEVELTHWNLNDGTLEGFRCVDVPAFAVQYHPEAAPGPHDSRSLFGEFRALMGAA
ncbi:MAG: glutamine-hydrolyzing carbamoyl-phosphate synthase small subunit [Candidatus Velamenicoccus archaeovorus]